MWRCNLAEKQRRGKGATVAEKGEIGMYGDAQEHFPKATGGKTRGADFHEFLQRVQLKDWSLRSCWT